MLCTDVTRLQPPGLYATTLPCCTQADAAKLFKEEVYPDIIGRHECSRGRSEPGTVPTVNAIVAQKHSRAMREAFGVDGAQLQRMSVSCVITTPLPHVHLHGSGSKSLRDLCCAFIHMLECDDAIHIELRLS